MIRFILPLLTAACLCQCSTTESIDRASAESWNSFGIWKKVPGSKADYFPAECPASMALSAKNGEWLVDPQDGARFFVPLTRTKNYTVGMLKAEAQKSINAYPLADQTKRNKRARVVNAVANTSLTTALAPLLVVNHGFHRLIGAGVSSSYSSSSLSSIDDSPGLFSEVCTVSPSSKSDTSHGGSHHEHGHDHGRARDRDRDCDHNRGHDDSHKKSDDCDSDDDHKHHH